MLGRYAICVLAASFAFGGGASAMQVKRKVEVAGDMAKVWTDVGAWCGIGAWHPAVAKCEESEAGGQKRRTITLKDGGVIKETLVKTTATSYSYRIDESPLPVSNYTATFSVAPGGKSKDRANVIWTAKFDPKGKKADARKAIEGVFKGGLDQIKTKY